MDKSIIISVKTVAVALLAILGIYLIFRLGNIIGLLVIAFLITIALEKLVVAISKLTLLNKPINRPAAVLITYLTVFLSLSVVISIGLDPVLTQSQKLLQTMSKEQSIFSLGENVDISLSELISSFVTTSGGVLTATKSIFDNVTGIISILILSIYMSIDWLNIKNSISNLFSGKKKERARTLIDEIEQNVGLWLRGQLILMLAIGVLSYISLLIIGIKYPLALGIMAGLLEIVPIIGPIVTAVIVALVALVDSPIKAVIVVIVFTIIQQIEGNIIVPKVMQKVSGFSPIIILVALLVGGQLFGIIGTILAVPILMVSAVIVKNVLKMYPSDDN